MSASYRLRPATADDEDALLRLHRAAMGDYLARAVGAWDDAEERRYHREWLARGRARVVEVDGATVGLLDVSWEAEAAYVYRLELDAGSQGGGLGSALLDDVLREAARRGLPVRLHVFPFNPARRLYERAGFREVAVDGPSVVMQWDPPGAGPAG